MPIENFDGDCFVAFTDISGFKEMMKHDEQASLARRFVRTATPCQHHTKLDRPVRNPDTAVMRDIERTRRRYQFSLRTLMLATTLSAILLGIAPAIGTFAVVLVLFYATFFAICHKWEQD